MPWALLFAMLGVLSRLVGVLLQARGGACGITSCWRGTIVHFCLVQLLAVSVSVATDVWTRRAFVAGGGLQHQEGRGQAPGDESRELEGKRKKAAK